VIRNFNDLRAFCYYLVQKYGSPEKASEEQKAQAFRNVYLKGLPVNLKTLRAIVACCDIKVNSSDRLPENVRGFNEVVNGTKNIIIKDGDTVSGIQNTILHEIREIMEDTFPAVCPEYVPLKTTAKHIAANHFATAVLLPRESFVKKIYETGFDVLELSKLHAKSCSQVLLRIGEVMEGKLFLYAALYEPDPNNIWRVTYWTASRNHDDSEANVYGLDSFFPRKGRAVALGSLVDMTIKEGKPHLIERISLLDELDDEGLVALANPFLIQGLPAKVVLLVLLSRNAGLLSHQVGLLNPIIVDGFHRHL
jgi:hypothetical protein